jgi:hypothetical protein
MAAESVYIQIEDDASNVQIQMEANAQVPMATQAAASRVQVPMSEVKAHNGQVPMMECKPYNVYQSIVYVDVTHV